MKQIYLLLFALFGGLTAQAQYCIPTYVTGPVQGDSIVSFQLGAINGVFPGAASGYNDYTTQASTNLVVGQTYSIDLTNNPSSGMSVSVWIDYDQNNAFDAGELVGSSLLTPGTTGQITFTVPTGATAGATRLRMVSAATLGVLTPCGAYDFGETEDYETTIIPPPADDMGVSAIAEYGQAACGLSASESITVELTNFGLNAQSNFALGFSVNSGPATIETYTPSLASGAIDTFTFAGTADFSGSNTTYTVQVWTDLIGDANSLNDTLTYTFTTAFVAVPNPTYLEDFETFINDGNFSGNGTGLNNGWTNNPAGPTSDYNWSVRTGGTGSGSTGPDVDHTFGTTAGTYMYTESSPFNGTIATLTSPCVDLTAAANPRLSFWYHMFGASTGTLSVLVGNDTLWTLSGQQQTASADPWREAIVDLAAYAGQSITITFIGEKAGTVSGDMAIDDVLIAEPPAIDAAALEVVSPLGGTCLTNAETIEVLIRNEGSSPLDFSVTPLPVSVAVQTPGGALVPYTTIVTTGTLAPLATQVVAVTNSGDFSAAGIYSLGAVVNLPGDLNSGNDTTGLFTTQSIQTTSLPFVEDFETFTESTGTTNAGALDSDWTRNFISARAWYPNAGTTPSTFATGPAVDHTLGTAAGIYMYTEASGPPAGSEMFLVSPCIDLGTANLTRLTFWYHMHGSAMGTLEAGYIDSNGDTTFVWSLSGEQQTDNPDPWLEAEANLPSGLSGSVQLVFKGISGGTNSDMAIDDVQLSEVLPEPDLKALEILSPVSGCGLTASELIAVRIANIGAVDANNATISYAIDGGTPVTESLPNIPFGDTLVYTFTAPADFSALATYGLEVWGSVANDPNLANDSLQISIENEPQFSLPISENFDSYAQGVTVFPDLVNDPDADLEFETNSGTTSSTATGPSDDVSGGGNYAYIETSGSSVGDQAIFCTNCVDLGGTANPRLTYGYHMFGESINFLSVDVTGSDGSVTNVSLLSGQQQTATTDPWRFDTVDLTPFVGDVVKVCFTAEIQADPSNFTFNGDVALDEINIRDVVPFDVGVSALISPNPDTVVCGLSATEQVTVEFTNFGIQPLTTIDLSYEVGGTLVTETLNTNLAPNASATYTFNAPADLSASGVYPFTLIASTPNDGVLGNDTLLVDVTNTPVISSYPYLENFESGPAFWTTGGENSSWAFGTPAKDVIIGAASGTNAWVTGGLGTGDYNANESSFVVGPCFDFSGLALPVVRMDIWWQSENGWDGATLQSSIDGGLTWQNVGALGDPNNWYNRNNFFSGAVSGFLNDEGWSGRNTAFDNTGSGGWLTAENLLGGLGGQPEVRLRVAFASDGSVQDDGFAFDNIEIFELPPFNVAMNALTFPLQGSNCGLGTQVPVTVQYVNFGSAPMDTVNLSYSVNGGAAVTEQAVISALPGDTVQYTFTATVDLSTVGPYDFTIWGTLANDTDNGNDTLANLTVIHEPPTGLPVSDNFDSYPEAETVFPDFVNDPDAPLEFETEAGTTTSTATGPSDDVSVGGNYVYMETSGSDSGEVAILCTNCLDLTTALNPRLFYAYHMFGESINFLSVDLTSSDGTVTNLALYQGQQQTATTDPWRFDTVDLAPFIGDVVQVCFTGETGEDGSGFTFNGDIALDEITIREVLPNDVGVTSIIEPSNAFCSSDSTTVTVELLNVGTLPQFSIPVVVDVPGGVPGSFTSTFTDTLDPGETAIFTVGTFNSGVGGTLSITAYTDLSTDLSFGNDTSSILVDVSLSAPAPVIENDSACATDSAQFTLIATNVQDVTYWYDSIDGNVPVFVGDTFQTPFLTATREYYVETLGQASYLVGPVDNTIGTGGVFTALTAQDQIFEVYSTIVIDSFTVYPQTPGDLVVRVLDAAGTNVLQTTNPIPVATGGLAPVRVGVGLTIPPGTYRIDAEGSTIGGLYRNSAGAVYPYAVPGVMAITDHTFSATGPDYFYYFYNWQVSGVGCPSDRVVATAFFRPAANVDLGPDGIQCEGFTIDAFDPGSVSYLWNTGDMTPSITADTTGVYYVDVVNAQGCTGTDTVILTVLPAPSVDLGPDSTVCGGLLLDAGNPGSSYTWQNPDSSDQTFFADQTGTYAVTVIDQGCSATDTVDLVVNPAPVVDLGGPSIVSCNDVTLDAGNPTATYAWSTGANTQDITVTPPATGADTITVTVTGTNGCKTVDQVVIEAGTPPALAIAQSSPVTGCDSVTLDAQATGVTYMWMPTGATTESITVSSSDTYLVTATDPATGCENTASVDVDLSFTPVADASFAVLDPATGFSYEFVNQSTAAGTVTWDFGDGSPTVTGDTVSHTYQFVGGFLVTMTISNDCGTDNTTLELGSVSLDDAAFGQAISLYPNPTTGRFSLTGANLSAERLEIEVYDARGRLVQSLTLDNVMGGFRQEVDLSEAAEGVYQLRITDGQRVALKRVVRH